MGFDVRAPTINTHPYITILGIIALHQHLCHITMLQSPDEMEDDLGDFCSNIVGCRSHLHLSVEFACLTCTLNLAFMWGLLNYSPDRDSAEKISFSMWQVLNQSFYPVLEQYMLGCTLNEGSKVLH